MSRELGSLGDLDRVLRKIMGRVESRLALSLNACAENTKRHIQGVFGDTEKLEPNAQSTIDRKGFDAPLIETGELRESIETEHAIVPAEGVAFGAALGEYRAESGVGTADEKMLWHEYGSAHYPPRPAMATGTLEATIENQAIITAAARSIILSDFAPSLGEVDE